MWVRTWYDNSSSASAACSRTEQWFVRIIVPISDSFVVCIALLFKALNTVESVEHVNLPFAHSVEKKGNSVYFWSPVWGVEKIQTGPKPLYVNAFWSKLINIMSIDDAATDWSSIQYHPCAYWQHHKLFKVHLQEPTTVLYYLLAKIMTWIITRCMLPPSDHLSCWLEWHPAL
jgi:hypothetical protein